MAEETEETGRDVRLLRSITLRNILSFGPDTPELELRALNVLIGPNGSGKSNVLDAIALLRAAPRRLTSGFTGGSADWIWKGTPDATAHVEAIVRGAPIGRKKAARQPLRYSLEFRVDSHGVDLTDERLANETPAANATSPYLYFVYEKGRAMLNVKGQERQLKREEVEAGASILAQRRDPDQYPELTYVADAFGQMRLYREWTFGRGAAIRDLRKTDERNDFLAEDSTNLGLMLSRLRKDPAAKRLVIRLLNELYESITDFDVIIEAGSVQIFLEEGTISVPASRLSDGTLRYLSLLAILCQPKLPPLICLEEPELGLHPDAVLAVGKLIKDASERTQLLVTTHSDILVDVLGADPENIVVCEKQDGQTRLTRYGSEQLKGWLERYSISELWTRGHLGGNRW
ncbi:MAG: chromosome segregation protein SMC [Hymenobacter sp.]|nr:MAG: chromosome segregation protein SMC [Hymenobacter sp.]